MNKTPIIEKYEDKKLDLAAWSVVVLTYNLLMNQQYTLDFEMRAVSWIDKEFKRVKSVRGLPINGRIDGWRSL